MRTDCPSGLPACLPACLLFLILQLLLASLAFVRPPLFKALGVGMYQHDLAEKDLDQALRRATVDAVAVVGVDVNRASRRLLSLVPGLNDKLAAAIVAARQAAPLRSRQELLSRVSGIGPVTFRNAAGFLQVRQRRNGRQALDSKSKCESKSESKSKAKAKSEPEPEPEPEPAPGSTRGRRVGRRRGCCARRCSWARCPG